MDSQLHMGSNLLVAGPTNSGKTIFVMKMLHPIDAMFDVVPQAVYWYYGKKTQVHDILVSRNYNMLPGPLPDNFDHIIPNSVVVIDDLMRDGTSKKSVTDLMVSLAHHTPCFVVNIVQNLFFYSKELRTQNLNSQYKCLFPNAQAPGQIQILARQMFPAHTQVLLQAFLDATRRPYGYLFLDFHQKTSELIRIRTNILSDEAPQIVYLDKRLYAEAYPIKLVHG